MNIPAVTHRGRGIDCYPLDEHTFRIRLTTAKGDFDRAEICYCMNKYAWSTQRQTLPLPRIADDDTLDYYQIDLTGDDTRLCYLFLLYYNSECFYFSEEGLSRTYDFERAYYTFFQYPYIFPAIFPGRIRRSCTRFFPSALPTAWAKSPISPRRGMQRQPPECIWAATCRA